MPETCEKPYHQEVEHRPRGAFAVAAKRNVHVFPKPSAERDMPSAPEISDTPSHIGVLKVCWHIKTKHFAKSHCHQGISAEIEIKLHGVGKCAEPCKRGGDTLKTDCTYFIPQCANAVCDDHLVAKTDNKSFEAIVKRMNRNRAFF